MADFSPLDATRNTFFDECAELIGVTELGLEQLASGASDGETLHGIFRAVHSIKGGAGAFRFVQLVNFAHVFETTLDALREGRLAADPAVVAVLLRATDVLSDLVSAARDDRALGDEFGGDVAAALSDLLGCGPTGDADSDSGAKAAALAPTAPPRREPGSWRITFIPHEGLLRKANEPLLLIRDLRRLGTLRVSVDASRVPALDEMNCDAAYLSWVFDIETAAGEAELREVFEFVQDDCELRVEALPCDASEAAALPETSAPPLAPSSPSSAAVAAVSSAAPAVAIGVNDDKIDVVVSLTQDLWAFYVDKVARDTAVTCKGAAPSAAVHPQAGGISAVAVARSEPSAVDARRTMAKPLPNAGVDQSRPTVDAAASTSVRADTPTAAPSPPQADQAPTPPTAAGSIRVDLEKIDRLFNLVGELVITQAMLFEQSNLLPVDQFPVLIQGVEALAQSARELQDSVMAIRAQPVKSAFARMPRIVRELAAMLGKEVRIVTAGETTEIDKTVIEQLNDPLTHMIRNALDHGIELPDERVAAGKPRQGTIHLSAAQRGGRIVIEVADDGRGINREKVLAKARDRGLVPPGAVLSEEEIDNLIFVPAFSTADTISNVSGRGVGMDVVKRNVQSLGGRISVQSRFGAGSRFTLSLPLTLAVLDGMVVSVSTETFIIPLTSIIESLRPQPADVHRVAARGDVLALRGEYVPIVRLHRCFAIENAISDPCRGIVIIVQSENAGRIGVVVDELLGQQQVVVKSLEANYAPVSGVSGATILGNGRVALILDVAGLREVEGRIDADPRDRSPKHIPAPVGTTPEESIHAA